MGLDNLSAFFKKFDHLRIPNETVRKATAQVIQDEMGIEIDLKTIQFKNGCISITADPLVKSELFLRKTTLLKKIRELSEGKGVIDIR